ncbi:hypothetical protein PT015_07265 [Candidatus Mycobacterium wuenschmannii]|uniref:Uncharacterized protein n=1 Tax=Candidatus Mycobacterium wuenschmannii TaxID=3027808 RepID=A0ABY8W0G1_9MYCO|nr:hypothetical protein [Candidatus Mycobacterium wuenschmannii]WIM89237.1 hypothetical protein PT015_07265 [Candidatus Mycobacterium wuenschmannii]
MAAAVALIGPAIGLATTASAAPPPDGAYVLTVTGSTNPAKASVGSWLDMNLSSCGESCVHADGDVGPVDLHPQGSMWSGTWGRGAKVWFDENSLAGGIDSADGVHVDTQMRHA